MASPKQLSLVLLVVLLALTPFQAMGAASATPSSPPAPHFWAKTYGGSGSDSVYAVAPTSDGLGYVVAGSTSSFGAGSGDAWVLKLDGSGNITWQKTYGGSGSDAVYAVAPTSDGGYVVAGSTTSFSVVSGDFWVLKLDGSGNVLWQWTYGQGADDSARAIVPTSDGGYVVAGYSWPYGAAGNDAWVLKLDASGNITWQKTYGGSTNDYAWAVAPTRDGGYVAAGSTYSFGAGSGDAWVLKLNASGNVTWQKTYGGGGVESARAVVPTSDGGYVVAGSTSSFGAGGDDAWVLKLDANGAIGGSCSVSGSSSSASVSSSATGSPPIVAGAITTATVFPTLISGQPTTAAVATQCAFTPAVQFSVASYSVNENAGTATIPVTLNGPLALTTTVSYATSNGTAIAGTNYTAASGTLTFPPGQTSRTFAVPILDDGVYKGNATVNLALSSPAGLTLGSPNPAILTILETNPPRLYLPVLFKNYLHYFDGSCEIEPNNTYTQANGPLRSGLNYCGYPDDAKDYFSVYLGSGGTITVDLTNDVAVGQLQLFYQSTANRVAIDLAARHIAYTGAAGWYYIYIATTAGFSSVTPYTLRVTYP
jgi:hypothetical protein